MLRISQLISGVTMKHKQPFFLIVKDRVLQVTANGVWTLTDATEYVDQLRNLVQPLINEPWAIILDARDWHVSPAEVFALLRDNTQWCFQHKLMYAVTLLPDDSMLQWQFIKATDIEKPQGFESHFVNNEPAAEVLLRAAGYLD